MDSIFPRRNVIRALVEGFQKLENDPAASVAFLKVLLGEDPLAQRESLLAAMPVTMEQIAWSKRCFSKEYRREKLRWFEEVLSSSSNVNDWPFAFANAANAAALGNEAKELLERFNTMCSKMSALVDKLDDVAILRIEKLRQEILAIIFDDLEHAPPERRNVNSLVDPLTSEDISCFAEIGNALEENNAAKYIVRSEKEAGQLLRFLQCCQNERIQGYENIGSKVVAWLLANSKFCFETQNAHLITEFFICLCTCKETPFESLLFFKKYSNILLRPYAALKPIRSAADYIAFLNDVPSRLCDTLAWSIKNGETNHLLVFLADDECRNYVDSPSFIEKLCGILDYIDLMKAKAVYEVCHSKHISVFDSHLPMALILPENKQASDQRFEERVLIRQQLRRWRRYYDCPDYIQKAIMCPDISKSDIVEMLLLGYSFDKNAVISALRLYPDLYPLISPQLKRNSYIQSLIEDDGLDF